MLFWINGPARRPELTRDRSVKVEVTANAAGNIRIEAIDNVDDPTRKETWISGRLDEARALRAALDKAIGEVEARAGYAPINPSHAITDNAISKLWDAANAMHAQDLFEEILTRAELYWRCNCGAGNWGDMQTCGDCDTERIDPEKVKRLDYLEALLEDTGGRVGPEIADEIDELRREVRADQPDAQTTEEE